MFWKWRENCINCFTWTTTGAGLLRGNNHRWFCKVICILIVWKRWSLIVFLDNRFPCNRYLKVELFESTFMLAKYLSLWTSVSNTFAPKSICYKFPTDQKKNVQPQNELLLFFYRFFSPLASTSTNKKWIKNCYIHTKVFFVCKHFTYVSVTNSNFLPCELRRRGGNMNSTRFYSRLFALHYLIWIRK